MKPNNQEWFQKQFAALGSMLQTIIQKENQIMTQLTDLDADIAAEEVDVQGITAAVTQTSTLASKIAADVTALLAKIAGGSTPTDLTAEIAKITADTTMLSAGAATLNTAATQLQAADTAANPPPPAP